MCFDILIFNAQDCLQGQHVSITHICPGYLITLITSGAVEYIANFGALTKLRELSQDGMWLVLVSFVVWVMVIIEERQSL